MTIKVGKNDGCEYAVVEINEKSKLGRFTILCSYVGFATLVGMAVKTVVKTINKITKKGA